MQNRTNSRICTQKKTPKHSHGGTKAMQMEIFRKTALESMIYPHKRGYLSHLMRLPSKLDNSAPKSAFTSLRN